jgi:hypothetical protein
VERPQHRPFCSHRRLGVVDVVYQERQAQHVRQQDEFLVNVSWYTTRNGFFLAHIPHVAADLAASDQKRQPCHPLICADTSLSRKVVKVRYQPRHDVFQSCIVRLRVNTDRVGRDVVNCEVQEHWCPRLCRCHGFSSTADQLCNGSITR